MGRNGDDSLTPALRAPDVGNGDVFFPFRSHVQRKHSRQVYPHEIHGKCFPQLSLWMLSHGVYKDIEERPLSSVSPPQLLLPFVCEHVPCSFEVFTTCGPPRNSIEKDLPDCGSSSEAPSGPTEYTETISGYLAPNSCSAGSRSASALRVSNASRASSRVSFVHYSLHFGELLFRHFFRREKNRCAGYPA